MFSGLSTREKMVYSGISQEIGIANLLRSNGFDYPILLNREFLDPRTGRFRECDLIFITPFKIYCIESKNYNGYIAGKRFDKKWRFASSGRRGEVANPYTSNRTRIRLMRSKFYSVDCYPPYIDSVIVVPDRCKIHCDTGNVYSVSDFISLVKVDSVSMKEKYKVDAVCTFLENNSRLSEKGRDVREKK